VSVETVDIILKIVEGMGGVQRESLGIVVALLLELRDERKEIGADVFQWPEGVEPGLIIGAFLSTNFEDLSNVSRGILFSGRWG